MVFYFFCLSLFILTLPISTGCKSVPEDASLPPFHLLSPLNNAILPDSAPHLVWSNDAEKITEEATDTQSKASRYEVWLDGENIATVDKGIDHYTEIQGLEWETSHEWYIVAVDARGRKQQSAEVFRFTVSKAPLLIFPGMNSTSDPVFEFSWDGYYNPDKWEIIVDDNEDFSSPVISQDSGLESGVRAGLYNGDIFDYTPRKGVSVIKDLLTDVHHYYEIESEEYYSPTRGTGENWSSAGAGTLFYDDDTMTWYVSFRNRAPADDPRPNNGYSWELWKHDDGYLRTPWTKVWEVLINEDSIIEGVCLRKYNNLFYYYFCNTHEWTIHYITAETVEEIGDRLAHPSTWNPVMKGLTKDPHVMKLNDNKYYMLIQGDTSRDHYALFRSPTPDFASYTKMVIDMHKPYTTRYKDDARSPGTILYDKDSGKYIYWGTERHGGDIFWFWTSSYDLVDWELEGRTKVYKWYKHDTTARYQSVVETDDKIVILMDWDDDRDDGEGLFIWEYFKHPVPARTFALKEPLPHGQFWWKVRGIHGDIPGPFSAVGTFYVQ